MCWTAKPLAFLEKREKSLDLRVAFQDFWGLAESSGRLNRPLRQAFENLVESQRPYEILKVEERPGAVRLTLANMWRLIRLEGKPWLLLQTFDMAQGLWREQAPEAITWHKYEQGLAQPNNSEIIWPDLETSYRREKADPGLFKNIMAAWLEKVRPALSGEIKPSLPPEEEEGFALSIFRWLVNLPDDCRSEVIDTTLRRLGFLTSLFPLNQPHNIRLCLSRILAAQEAHLARISRESPNVWPILYFIPPAYWSRRDLLQDRVLRAASPIFKNFSPAGLRWLRRVSAETLLYFHHWFKDMWTEEDQPVRAAEVAELMASLPPQATGQPELAEAVFACFWELFDEISAQCPDCAPVLIKRLLRLQARHITALWDFGENPKKKEELNQVHVEVVAEWEDILDWFSAEGHRLGLPVKNSTWRSLKRRSDKWHEDFRRTELLKKPAGKENTAWKSLLGETVIDGLKVSPLITELDLFHESLEMRHCVVTFAPLCLNHGYRIFSLLETDGIRSTLSLRPQSNGYAIDQHKGLDNAPVSKAAAEVAREVCRLYNEKHLEAAGNLSSG